MRPRSRAEREEGAQIVPAPHPLRALSAGNISVFGVSVSVLAISLHRVPLHPWITLLGSISGASVLTLLGDRLFERAAINTGKLRVHRKVLQKIRGDASSLQKELKDPETEPGPIESLRSVADQLTSLLHFATTVFDSKVEARCSLTLKLLFISRDGIPVVHTTLRDPRSQREREEDYHPRNNFPFQENTAFNDLVTKSRFGSLYLANDLAALSVLGKYKNSNERWEEFYNSTAVQAISPEDNPRIIVGFFCLDSWRDLSARKIGPTIARLANEVYYILQVLCLVQAEAEKRNIPTQQVFDIGWDCSEQTPKLINSEHQQLLQRAVASLEMFFESANAVLLSRFRESKTSDFNLGLPGARERSMGGELSRATSVPPETEGAMGARKPIADFDEPVPDSALSENDREFQRRLAEITPEEFEKTLRRVAKYNPYAAELLAEVDKTEERSK